MRRRRQAPFGIVGEYAHPVETVFLGFGTVMGPLLFAKDLHLVTLWMYLVARLWQVHDACVVCARAPRGHFERLDGRPCTPVYGPRRRTQVVDAHSGYDFPWSLRTFLPFWAGRRAHTRARVCGHCAQPRSPDRSTPMCARAVVGRRRAGADFHDHHHMVFLGNYGTSFRWCDWLFGTDTLYQAHKARLAVGKAGNGKKSR